LREYSISRAARIYSVALPAVILAILLDNIGKIANPGMYQSWWGYVGTDQALRAASLLTFTNELWNAHVNLGSLLPYWSLGFEVWYYAIFGAALFLRSWWRVAGVAMLAGIAGPKIMVLFPIWIAGSAVYLIGKHHVVGRIMGWISLVASGVSAIAFVMAMRGFWGPQYVLPYSGLATRYIEAAIFILNIVGIQSVVGVCPFFAITLGKPIRYLAGMTFSLYLVHLPLAQFIASVSPFPSSSGSEQIIVFCGTFALVALFAHVTERRKKLWRNWFEKVESGFLAFSSPRTV
jgi:peptidoglycan/LPS O-acetylase OafA/YrhL